VLHDALGHDLVVGGALEERVGLDLVDRGRDLAWSLRSTSRSGWKFDTPIARIAPWAYSFSIARQEP
jgi:hypothetical protein